MGKNQGFMSFFRFPRLETSGRTSGRREVWQSLVSGPASSVDLSVCMVSCYTGKLCLSFFGYAD